jgi:uncharacterized protein
MHPALRSVTHRPWPLPVGPWVMTQTWHDLLFAHWPIAVDFMRSLVPGQLELDTWDGQCWLGVVPFWMSNVRGRGLPGIPGVTTFPELNVRTYVTHGGKPGVYFFSLDAASDPAVRAARIFYHLPYFHAKMRSEIHGAEIAYSSVRKHGHAEFVGRYKPNAPVELRQAGTLEHWLSERYCLYTVHRGSIYRGEVHHQAWPLQNAEARIERNTMAAAAGLELPNRSPLVHFAKRLDVLIWPLRRASK